MEVISEYKDPNRLKRKIILQYLSFIKSELHVKQSLLADKDFAAEDCAYHKQYRYDLTKEVEKLKNQAKLLSI